MSTGGWREMFEERGGRPPGPAVMTPPVEPDDIELAPDVSVYRPWTLQRGRSRATLMLELRRYEPRSGLWSGWQLSLPSLIAIEYTGDILMSLDFGTRQFVIEGRGLDELARQFHQGSVVAVQEYAAEFWPSRPAGPIVSAIRRVGATNARVDA